MHHSRLEAARQRLGLSYLDLWIDCFALGGNLDADHVALYRRDDRPVSGSDHDVVVLALKERFQDRGEDDPLAYHPL